MDELAPGIDYRRCIVTYVDILGFKELISKSQKDSAVRAGILSALQTFSASLNDAGIPVEGQPPIQPPFLVRNFSDLLLRFRPIIDVKDISQAVISELVDICFAQATLLRDGILLRGAVTLGELFWDDNHVFGPGLVRAYEIESRLSTYPRIVVEPEVNRYLEAEEHLKYLEIISRDFDGSWFVDYLNGYFTSANQFLGDLDILGLSEIRDVITADLPDPQLPVSSKAQKTFWLARYYDRVVQKLIAEAGWPKGQSLQSLLINPSS
jgi:hypothetical protein